MEIAEGDTSREPGRPPRSLCETCRYMRETRGRREQRYLLCRNETIPAKYLPQPVVACLGYALSGDAGQARDDASS